MQVLLLPLRTFGDGGTGELVDGGIPARALVNPIAACINHARDLPIAWDIFAAVPAVPFRLDFGGDGHAADLQYRRHAALRHFQGVREDLDLLLSDVVLPGKNGRQLADEIKRRQPDVRVLFMSGYGPEAILQHGQIEPGTEVIQKPVTQQLLADRIRQVLEDA
jgi:CheY-like chemotaxis protein